ncbi:MAG TPA: 50S ribosomal protein L16 [archaeon]|nr:50S ribosomal protein L16 [archaeon]
MPLRPGRTMRRIERPFTRISISKPKKSYVKSIPHSKTHQFEMGNREGNFDQIMFLTSENHVQIRDNSIESARIVANKFLETKLGLTNFFFKILVYPHHVVREHSIAQGAGADRFSQGMRLSFGYPSNRAVQAKRGQRLIMLKLNKSNQQIGKLALIRAGKKLCTSTRIVIES